MVHNAITFWHMACMSVYVEISVDKNIVIRHAFSKYRIVMYVGPSNV